MEVTQTLLKTEIVEIAKKEKDSNGGGYSKGPSMETVEEKFNYRYSKLKEIMGIAADSPHSKVGDEWMLLSQEYRDLVSLLLR